MPIIFKFCFICVIIKLIKLAESIDTTQFWSSYDFETVPYKCQRMPKGVKAKEGDGGFLIRIDGNPDGYTRLKEYTVILENENKNTSFSAFYLVVEPESRHSINAGTLKIVNRTLSKVYRKCPKGIKYASARPKNQIQVSWIALRTETECVLFKATVLDLKGRWYEDQERLTLKLCKAPTTYIETCAVTTWSSWSSCSTTCGIGYRTRSRNYLDEFSCNVNCHVSLDDIQKCYGVCNGNLPSPPFLCKVTDWSSWTECSCNKMHRFRKREFETPLPIYGCILPLKEMEGCPITPPCNKYQEECGLGDWSEWSPCSTTCGDGKRVRTRAVLDEASFFTCNKSMKRYQKDNCIDITKCKENNSDPNCKFTEWTEWSHCSKTCGIGSQIKRRFEDLSARNGGKPCSFEHHEVKFCITPPCKPVDSLTVVDCKLTEWTEWTECPKTCGFGYQSRIRTVEISEQNGGKPCPLKRIERKYCEMPPCLTDCILTEWMRWSHCSSTCGIGYQTRRRIVEESEKYGGKPCPPERLETKNCEMPPCSCFEPRIEEHCNESFSRWYYDSKTKTCGVYNSCRENEKGFESFEECHMKCEEPLKHTCFYLPWNEWSPCSLTCGVGIIARRRDVNTMETPLGIRPTCRDLGEVNYCSNSECAYKLPKIEDEDDLLYD